MAIDPICKMQVDENKAAATATHKGKKYYFCALSCKKVFEGDPERYVLIDTISNLIKQYHNKEGCHG